MSEQEEAVFWQKKLLGTTSAKSLLNTIYFYSGKVFGLRGGGGGGEEITEILL